MGFQIKFKVDGLIEHYKEHLVVLRNTQKEEVDFIETFAPVAKVVTIRMFLSIVAARNSEVRQMHVHNAFFHGDLLEEV